MPQSHIDQTQGCGLVLVLAMFCGAGWIGYSFWYAPPQREHLSPVAQATPSTIVVPVDSAEAAVTVALGHEIPGVIFRLETMQAGNLNIFMSRDQFELVPYPDRAETVRQIGAAWCRKIDRTFAPAVRIRDERTGDTLATFGCLSGRAALQD